MEMISKLKEKPDLAQIPVSQLFFARYKLHLAMERS